MKDYWTHLGTFTLVLMLCLFPWDNYILKDVFINCPTSGYKDIMQMKSAVIDNNISKSYAQFTWTLIYTSMITFHYSYFDISNPFVHLLNSMSNDKTL